MKLAFVSTMTAAPWGGSEELWRAAARAALAAGDSVGLSTHWWPEQPPAIADLVERGAVWWPRGMPLAPSAPRRWRDRWPRSHTPAATTQTAFQPMFDFAPDVICISQGGTFDFLLHDDLTAPLRDAGSRYVVLCRFNTDDFFVHEQLQPRAAAFMSGAYQIGFAASRNRLTAERQLATRLPNACVIQSPIEVPEQATVSWPAEEEPQLACVARLDAAYKGQDLLLESLGAAEWRTRSWRLTFYGDGPDRSRLEQLTRFYDLSSRVRFAGHVSDLRRAWESSHLLVLPSRAEGTPQAMIQAMLHGRPSVVTDVGGTTEWLSEPETGFVAEAATASAISRGLERAWQRRDEWRTIGDAARRAAVARLDRSPGTRLLELMRAARAPARPGQS